MRYVMVVTVCVCVVRFVCENVGWLLLLVRRWCRHTGPPTGTSSLTCIASSNYLNIHPVWSLVSATMKGECLTSVGQLRAVTILDYISIVGTV